MVQYIKGVNMKNALKDFGPVYVINVKSREDRLNHIKLEFNKHGVKDYTVIEAVDGSNEDLSLLVDNIDSIPLSKNEIACSISHLKAIKHWLDTSTSEYAIIVEDDLTLETVDKWQWNWKEFLSKIDTYYDVLQLAITNVYKVNTSLHYREIRDSASVCYLIKRAWAEKLINKHFVDNKFVFNGRNRVRLVADGLIYNEAICLSFPLFTYSINFDSSINEEHVNTFHIKSRNETLEFWETNPKTLYRRLN
jgi:GR25 family glycosyltransferase involved in LPS biosynthesis